VTFAPLPSPEEMVRLYRVGELAAELARYHETASEGEEPFIAQCITLHNNGEIDLLAVTSTPGFAAIQGHDFFVAQHLYCEAIPKLRGEVRALMACCSLLIKQAGRDLAATQPNGAFQEWCTANPESAKAVIRQAQDGDELAKQFATFALRSLNDVDTAIAFIESFADDRRVSGMTALAGMRYSDGTEVQKPIATLERFVADGGDDNVRANALLAAFEILKSYSDPSMAAALLEAATKESGPATLHGMAQVVWLHHKELDTAAVGIALQALRSVPPENLGTINILDTALYGLLGTANESLALDCLTEMLRDGSLTLAQFRTTAHALSRDNRQRLYALVMRWLLSGSLPLCSNVNDLVGVDRDHPFDTTAAPLSLTPVQQIFVSRKAIGYLFVKPVVCCSIIVSILRAASPEVVDPLVELLFDPILLNYGGGAKDYLKAIPPTDAAYPAIQVALAEEEAFHKALDAIGTIKELHPSDYQRDVVHQRDHDEMRQVHKLVESKSILMNLVHRSTILYGKRSLTYFTDPDGQQHSVAMDLKSFETSFELPRHSILDPVGLDYMLRVFRVEKLK
jgi:hypothetical protein